MATSLEIQSKLKKGVQDAVAARNKTRQRPALARLAKLPGDVATLKELTASVRRARDHLQGMASKTSEVHAAIVAAKTEEYRRWGMVEGEKPNHWIDELGQDRRIVARDRAIDAAKKEHAKSTEGPRADIISALREVRTDLNAVDPLFHNQIAMLLRSTMGDRKRADYAQMLQGAGVVAINNAVLDAVMGEGNKALGAALCTILENDEALASRVKHSREEIADVLIHNEYWEAQTWIGLTRYHIEQSEVAVLTLEGKSISTDRKMKAGLMKGELEKAVGRTFNDDGDEIDSEGEIVKQVSVETSDNYIDKLRAESRARDAEIAAEHRKQANRKAAEDEVAANTLTEEEENRKYGGAAFAESMKA